MQYRNQLAIELLEKKTNIIFKKHKLCQELIKHYLLEKNNNNSKIQDDVVGCIQLGNTKYGDRIEFYYDINRIKISITLIDYIDDDGDEREQTIFYQNMCPEYYEYFFCRNILGAINIYYDFLQNHDYDKVENVYYFKNHNKLVKECEYNILDLIHILNPYMDEKFIGIDSNGTCSVCYEYTTTTTKCCNQYLCHICEIQIRRKCNQCRIGYFIKCPTCREIINNTCMCH